MCKCTNKQIKPGTDHTRLKQSSPFALHLNHVCCFFSATCRPEESEWHYLWISQLPVTRKGIKAVEERRGGADGAQRCMVENFKGEHRVHTDMRLRQQGRAHIDSTKKREGRTENIHITYTQWGSEAANTVNNNILHSCCVSVSEEASWQADKRRRSWGALGVQWGLWRVGVVVGV